MAEVETKVIVRRIADFSNKNVRFTFGECENITDPEHRYVFVAEQGLQRIALGGSKDQVRRFFLSALNDLEMRDGPHN